PLDHFANGALGGGRRITASKPVDDGFGEHHFGDLLPIACIGARALADVGIDSAADLRGIADASSRIVARPPCGRSGGKIALRVDGNAADGVVRTGSRRSLLLLPR